MLTYQELKENASRFLSMTSLEVVEFEALLQPFGRSWEAALKKRAESKPRKRKAGGGRKATLQTLEDKLLFILVYFKLYPIQEAQGAMFGVSQSQTNEWIQRLTPVLQEALGYEKLLPERNPASLDEILSEYDTLEFSIDGTERPKQRPKDSTKQKEYYSGKKKRIHCSITSSHI